MMNGVGLRTPFCGTPVFTVGCFEFVLLYSVYYLYPQM